MKERGMQWRRPERQLSVNKVNEVVPLNVIKTLMRSYDSLAFISQNRKLETLFCHEFFNSSTTDHSKEIKETLKIQNLEKKTQKLEKQRRGRGKEGSDSPFSLQLIHQNGCKRLPAEEEQQTIQDCLAVKKNNHFPLNNVAKSSSRNHHSLLI